MTQIGSSTPTYDANGSVTNDFLHTYSWDANGRPVTADSVGLTYDALGRMVEQNNAGTYMQIVWSPTGWKLAYMNGQTLEQGNFSLPAGAVVAYNSSGLLNYHHADWLGSYRLASTPNRTVYWDGAYAPFGEPYAQSGGPVDLSFTGMNQDTVPNLYDFPAREYGIQGRWPSADPAGISSVRMTNPQTWNRYAYANNSPLTLTDPTGMAPTYKSIIDLPKNLPGMTAPDDPSGGVQGGNIWGDFGAGFDNSGDSTGASTPTLQDLCANGCNNQPPIASSCMADPNCVPYPPDIVSTTSGWCYYNDCSSSGANPPTAEQGVQAISTGLKGADSFIGVAGAAPWVLGPAAWGVVTFGPPLLATGTNAYYATLATMTVWAASDPEGFSEAQNMVEGFLSGVGPGIFNGPWTPGGAYGWAFGQGLSWIRHQASNH